MSVEKKYVILVTFFCVWEFAMILANFSASWILIPFMKRIRIRIRGVKMKRILNTSY